NAWARSIPTSYDARAAVAPPRVWVFQEQVLHSLGRRPDHVSVLRRHGEPDGNQIRVAGRNVLAVIVAPPAAGQIPGVVDAGRDLVLVVVLQYQLQTLVLVGVITRGAGLSRWNVDVWMCQEIADILLVPLRCV